MERSIFVPSICYMWNYMVAGFTSTSNQFKYCEFDNCLWQGFFNTTLSDKVFQWLVATLVFYGFLFFLHQ